MRIKLILATSLLCAGMNAHAQNYNPSPIPCKKITPTLLNNYNGTIDANCIEDENNTNTDININGNQNVELKAGEEINLDGEVWVNPNANGNFYAHIEPSEVGLAWYQPYDTPGSVLKFDKVEIGVDMPDDVNQKIENYIMNSGLLKLNPFNPEDIDVKAEFFRNSNANGNGGWYAPLNVYGFYYEEFFENTTNASSLSWAIDPVTSEHKFRVRFAPPEVGLWRCKITITINNDTPQEVTYTASEFTFTVIQSANPGYVKVSNNKHYLELGGFPFFPSGRNIPQPALDSNGLNDQQFGVFLVDKNQPFDTRKINPAYHKSFRAELNEFKNGGGEDFRFLFFGDWYEIEFEKLNNYYDRLNTAWEMDRLVDHCSAIGVRMFMNFQNHEAFQWAGDYSNIWDWPAFNQINNAQCYSWNTNDVGYCYNSELGIPTPEEFLTDPQAKKYYKYRLRYITSRWGYSTGISMEELRSEMNNHAKYNDIVYYPSTNKCEREVNHFPYYQNNNNFLKNVSDWTHEMAEYLKTHQYNPHLLSVDYTGCPRSVEGIEAINDGDSSYFSPFVDVIAYNHYDDNFNRFESMTNAVRDLTHSDESTNNIVLEIINKPIIISETGLDYGSCDNGVEYYKFVWCSSFTGIAGSGMEWHHQHDYSLMQHNVNLRNFIGNLQFGANLASIWYPEYDVRQDKLAAMYCMRSQEIDKRVIGVIDNRTVNYWTMAADPNSKCRKIEHQPSKQNPDDTVSTTVYDYLYSVTSDDGPNRLMVPNLKALQKYKVDFYDVLTGNWLGSDVRRANLSGKFRLGFTVLDSSHPLIAFKLRENGHPLFSHEYDSIYHYEDELAEVMIDNLPEIELTSWKEEDKLLDINISPNPTSGILTVKCNFDGAFNVTISDNQNKIVMTTIASCNENNIDISQLQSGIYVLNVNSNLGNISKKIVKL